MSNRRSFQEELYRGMKAADKIKDRDTFKAVDSCLRLLNMFVEEMMDAEEMITAMRRARQVAIADAGDGEKVAKEDTPISPEAKKRIDDIQAAQYL